MKQHGEQGGARGDCRRRTAPRRPSSGRQQRGDRTRDLLIDETVRCIREEGFSAASARHIIERAGVSWGVIQHHFGDRDGLLTAVIDDALERLIASLEVLSDPAQVADTEHLVRATWEAFANPKAMAGLEILISTKELRTALDGRHMERLGAALTALMARLDTGYQRRACGRVGHAAVDDASRDDDRGDVRHRLRWPPGMRRRQLPI